MQPGGNVTGISVSFESLAPKRLELLRELLPSVRRIGMLSATPDGRTNAAEMAVLPAAARLGIAVTVAAATAPAELERAIAELSAARVEAILAVSAIAYSLRDRLIALATQRRLPVVGATAVMADAGALFSYGASLRGMSMQTAQLVDRVLRGASPADIPVQQRDEFELVLNLRAAKALGVSVPRSIALRAGRVIE